MSATERWLISAVFAMLVGIGSWLLSSVTINSARIAVLEQRTNNHDKVMEVLRNDLREHRDRTEFTNGKP